MCVATNAGSEVVAIGLPQCIDAGVASLLTDLPIGITWAIVEAGSFTLSFPDFFVRRFGSFLWHSTLLLNLSEPEAYWNWTRSSTALGVAEALEGCHPSTRQYIVSIIRCALFLTFVLFPVWTFGQERREQSARPSGLPIKRVVLYKNGVGYFEHLGSVRDNQDVTISFTSGQLNDVLKSLTVLDLNGGSITGVAYGSANPVEILENFHVTRDQIQTVLDFAARSAEVPPLETSQVR